MNDMTLPQRDAQVMRLTAAAQRRARLEVIFWQAYDRAQYRKYGVNEIPAGLDAGEREAYDAGLAGGDADRRQA